MRLPTASLSRLLSLSLLALPCLAVIQDEAYEVDWHIPLVGLSAPASTFFHRPQPDSKASLIYTLTDKKVLAAINPRDGAIVWRHSIAKDVIGYDAASTKARPAEGKVLSAAGSTLRAWDATDGRLLWAAELNEGIKDVRVSKEQDAMVLCADGSVRKVDGVNGDVIEHHRDLIGQNDIPHALYYSPDATYVVSLLPQDAIYRVQTTTIRGIGKSDTKTLSGSVVSNLRSIIFVGGPGIALWHEDNGRTLVLLSLKGQSMSTTPVPEGVIRIECHTSPSHDTFLISFDTLHSSWAEIWKIEGEHQILSKIHDVPSKPYSPTSWSASVASNGEIYFTWNLRSGASEIYSGSSNKPVYEFAGNSTEIQAAFLSVSEVIPRPDRTFALRTFLTSYPDTNTHLILNGAVSWKRPESLAGLKAAIWVELLDPTTEEVEGELHVEESQNVLAAYIHRVKRHVHELMVYGPAWAANLPTRIIAEFTGAKTETVAEGKFRDAFGFRKLIVGITSNGGIVGIDFSQRGKVLWSLFNLFTPVDIKGFYEIGKGVVGVVTAQGRYVEVDVFEGKITRKESPPDVTVMSTSLVSGVGDKKVIMAVVKSSSTGEITVKYYGGEINTSAANDVYLTIPDSFGDVHGYMVESKTSTVKKTFSFSPPELELITSMHPPIRHTPTASIGRVMGDRSVMYKYLNPNLLLVTTQRIDNVGTASVYLLDSVSGAVLYSATHQAVDKSKPIIALLCENWFVYTFFADEDPTSDTQTTKGYQVVVTELFESPHPNDRGPLRAQGNFSSLDPEVMLIKPYAMSQTYLSPVQITALSATSTKQSITATDILAWLPYPASLLSIPKRILDPRRPVGRDPDTNEREEGLFRYDPVFPVDHRGILTHKRELLPGSAPGEVKISASPSLMESTSLVVVFGGVDLFGTRVAPSGAFDMLGKGFGRLQLVGTVVGLAVGVWFVAPMVRKKQINQRWAPTSG